jgi:hypothetical protein
MAQMIRALVADVRWLRAARRADRRIDRGLDVDWPYLTTVLRSENARLNQARWTPPTCFEAFQRKQAR